ncbi:MAG: hypothetical protein LBD75_04755 [Candidatus Peribacteria bacterium]|jgi:hypothetical protein|nr:hypothetical protein [Candidatus Peribacteria bacterium]
MRHFNQAMEHTYQNYRDVISNKLFGAPDKLNTKINARRYQPFKLLNNLRNKRKFSYDIPSTQVGNAQVTISFKENNAFEITLQRYGKTYTFKGANLKNILKAKRGGKKVFEGIGNEVLALIHNQHFTALRENTKMLQENQLFAAKDPKTGRWYFMDDEGRLSYMAHWDNASLKAIQSEITTAANRKKGRHIAGAVGATAGAGWLGTGAGLSVAGIAKGVGAAGAGAIGGHKLFTKIFHKNEENYGVIHNADNIDLGRTYLSTEEQDQLLYSNPVLIGRLRKAMKNRMGIFESGRAALAKMRA